MKTEFARSQSTGISCVGRDAGTLAVRNTCQTNQHHRAEECLAIGME